MTIIENTSATFKSYLNSFMLFCKSQRHLTDTKICFSSNTASLVLAKLQPWAPHAQLARTQRPQSHHGATFRRLALETCTSKAPRKTNSHLLWWRHSEGWSPLPVSADLSGLLSYKAPKPQTQHSFKIVNLNPGDPPNVQPSFSVYSGPKRIAAPLLAKDQVQIAIWDTWTKKKSKRHNQIHVTLIKVS